MASHGHPTGPVPSFKKCATEMILAAMPIEVITDADIQALIDGELSPARQEIVITAISHDPLLQQRYDLLQKQKSLLLSWWAEEQEHLN